MKTAARTRAIPTSAITKAARVAMTATRRVRNRNDDVAAAWPEAQREPVVCGVGHTWARTDVSNAVSLCWRRTPGPDRPLCRFHF